VIFIFEKFKCPEVLKGAYEYDIKTFILELFKILKSSSRKWAVKIEIQKKIMVVTILGCTLYFF
jgi:hypothetical protein